MAIKIFTHPLDLTDCIESILGEFLAKQKQKICVLHFQKNHPLPPVVADKEKLIWCFKT
jgi:hypothetical protein